VVVLAARPARPYRAFGRLRAFLTVTERDHMTVDKSLGEKLRITLNVTFPALNCAELHLDAMDVAGTSAASHPTSPV
jgi:hypothetical protein